MTLADASAMVAQFPRLGTPEQREAITLYVAATGVNVIHAAWVLYGRDRGKRCMCTPCMTAPPTGSEAVVRILLQGRAPEEVSPVQ